MVKKESIDLDDIFPEVEFNEKFKSDYSNRLRSRDWKKRIRIQLKKIICDPFTVKPMKIARKGTREVYVSPYRLSYFYSKNNGILAFLRIYHKDKQ